MKLLLLAFFFSTAAMAATELTLKTPRGTNLPVIVYRTALIQPRAVLVLAPDQNCNIQDPLLENLSRDGEKNGLAVIRFEWSFCSRSKSALGNPSQNYHNEIEDMQTVVTFARGFSYGDIQRVFVSGKSLGSIVAYHAFNSEPDLRGLLLLNPICSYTPDPNGNALPNPVPLGDVNYPNFDNITRPVMIVVGNRDPVCVTPVLYDFLKTTKTGRVSVLVGIGDHNFSTFDPKKQNDEIQSLDNVHALIPAIVNWINFNTKK